jgi:HAD superfamily hydrolase (TIGR01490 family)
VRLAIFDLDNTLIAGDSDYEWGRFLADQGIVDGPSYERANREFYEQYKAGTLDIRAFCRFSFRPLAEQPLDRLLGLRENFFRERIEPLVLPAACDLLAEHRRHGHVLMIITATNRFVSEPVAMHFGVDHLLATEPEFRDGRYTGELTGIPCFQHGKVQRLEQWLAEQGHAIEESWFYSDSHNDIPLLEMVDHPVAVDADVPLSNHAAAKDWKQLSLRVPA